jgi:hypothetical protein
MGRLAGSKLCHHMTTRNHSPSQNAIDVISQRALNMLDKAANDGGLFFLTIAPAVPHIGLNSTSQDTFAPIPQKKWNSRYDDFYDSQPKFMFTACKEGYLIEYEVP